MNCDTLSYPTSSEASDTFCQGCLRNFFAIIQNKPLDFVAHGFFARFAEMDFNAVGGFPDFLYHNGLRGLLYGQRGSGCGGAVGLAGFIVHRLSFHRKKPSCGCCTRAGVSYSKSESAKVQGAKALRFALSDCGFGLVLLLDEVVPLTADAPCAQNIAHIALGVLYRPLGYSGLGGGFYYFLAGKLLSVHP